MVDFGPALSWSVVDTSGLVPSDYPQDLKISERFQFNDLRSRFLRRRRAVRDCLARWIGIKRAYGDFVFGPYGKPSLHDGPELSVSHDQGQTMVTVSNDGPVGVDIQTMNDRRTAHLNNLFDTQYDCQSAGRVWTQMEAIAKWNGQGLQLGFRRLFEQVQQGQNFELEGYSYALKSWSHGNAHISICQSCSPSSALVASASCCASRMVR